LKIYEVKINKFKTNQELKVSSLNYWKGNSLAKTLRKHIIL